jgi:ACS family sodium-dependent inorganic phosphate cotransporter
MSSANALGAFAMGGFGSNHLDIAPRHAGVLMGVTNTAGTIPGIVGVTVSGFILDATGSWATVFALAAAIYAVGLVVWLLFATGERVFD